MGFFIIVSILMTHFVAERYTSPEVEISIVCIVTIVLLVISHAVINSFERVARTSQLKSEFISIISHELRNPLSSIKWQVDLLNGAKQGIGDAERKSITIIAEQNERMIRMINDLLDVSRIEDRAFGLSPEVFSLSDLTTQVLGKYEGFAKASNLKLIFNRPKSDFKVKADEIQFRAVISRFVDNAIRYSAASGEIILTIEDLGERVRWSIADQGVGIPAQDVQHIFSKFFRASNALRYQTEGLGIGLYVTKNIIELSGGSIGFNTIEGRGSTFYFILPKQK